MKIVELTEDAFLRPTCAASVGLQTRRWRAFVKEDNCCRLTAQYRVDKMPLCERHAAKVVIAHVLDRGGTV